MILLTSLYHEADGRRREELHECLRRNIAAEQLDEIHVFTEDAHVAEELQSHAEFTVVKVHLIAHGRRVTYQDLFAYANQQLIGRGVIIANADIFFDDTLARLNDYELTGKLLCLSRWDVHADGSVSLFEHPSSQDAWIFKAPIPSFNCDFHLGLLGCDNRLAWEAEQAGLKLSNPSRTLRATHLHVSQVRHYSERQRLTGPTRSISVTALETPYPSSLGPPPAGPCAAVEFGETMGYTVAPLVTGASSHNNDERPLTAIPEALGGLEFTQVVSSVVSPVEVEFLNAGKLFVLVGNDWEGHNAATAWLGEKGYKEDLPLVETQCGTAFEVWSLFGESGARFVLPTQVMLATNGLFRKSHSAVAEQHAEPVVCPPARHLLIATRAICGLWSMFFQVIGLIRYAERHGLEPVVYFNAATCWWSNDGYNGSRNAWEYFFEPIGPVSAMELLGTKSGSLEHASGQQIQADLPNDIVMSDYILDHVGHYDHTEAQRQEYASIVERRIRVRSEVLRKLDPALLEALSSGATAVHYRGTDKSCQSPRLPVDEYYDALQNRVDPSHRLFVATDDAQFLEGMIGAYGDRVLYTQAARSRDQTPLHLGPQRGPQQAEECLLDVLLMARCQHLVHSNSSVTNGVLVFNPAMTHDALHLRAESEQAA